MSRRRSIRRVALGAVLGLAVVVFVASPPAAHVEVDPESVPKGSTTTFSFRVPNEEDNASTVGLIRRSRCRAWPLRPTSTGCALHRASKPTICSHS